MPDRCHVYIRVRDGTGSTTYTRPSLATDASDAIALQGAQLMQKMIGGVVYAVDIERTWRIGSARPAGGSVARKLAIQFDDPAPATLPPITLFVPTVTDGVFVPGAPILDVTNPAIQSFAAWAITNAREADGSARALLSGGVLTIESK